MVCCIGAEKAIDRPALTAAKDDEFCCPLVRNPRDLIRRISDHDLPGPVSAIPPASDRIAYRRVTKLNPEILDLGPWLIHAKIQLVGRHRRQNAYYVYRPSIGSGDDSSRFDS